MSQNHSSINDCWNSIGVWGHNAERCPELDRVVHCRNCTVYSAAGRLLLNRSPSSEYLDEWTDRLAGDREERQTGTTSAFVFREGLQWFALPVAVVREVAVMGPIHIIPHRSNNILRGVVNIKGKLEICVSLGAVLEVGNCVTTEQSTENFAPARFVVVSYNSQALAFPVTEVMGIIRYQPEAVRDLPAAESGIHKVYISGMLHYDNREISFLKYNRLFHSLTRDLI